VKYAERTNVPVERSKGELERLLRRYGAEGYGTIWKAGVGTIVRFQIAGRPIQMKLASPVVSEKTPSGRRRSPDQVEIAFEQAERQSWRALLLIIQAKLEAIESKIASLDEEFLPYILLAGGETVADRMVPQIEAAIRGEQLPALLPKEGL